MGVQFYSHDAVFLESVTHLIGEALKNGNVAIVFATKPHRETWMLMPLFNKEPTFRWMLLTHFLLSW
jgi:hypothetical protein